HGQYDLSWLSWLGLASQDSQDSGTRLQGWRSGFCPGCPGCPGSPSFAYTREKKRGLEGEMSTKEAETVLKDEKKICAVEGNRNNQDSQDKASGGVLSLLLKRFQTTPCIAPPPVDSEVIQPAPAKAKPTLPADETDRLLACAVSLL